MIAKLNLDRVRQAAKVVSQFAHRTPVVNCASLDQMAGHRIHFKCENFQKVGAFKFRGAIFALSQLTHDQKRQGVITHSSGNHGQALALAAQMAGVSATVVMPRNAPRVKQDAIAGYGARIVLCEPTLEAREQGVADIQTQTGATLVPPFDHPDIIAGQGTCALELLEQAGPLDAILAPIGGGGLISGTAIVASGQQPAVKVIAAEPDGADDAYRSKQAGERIPQLQPNTIADGLLTSLGDWTWPLVRDVVHQIVTVSDRETVEAMKAVWSRAKLVIEPSAAVTFAAACSSKLDLPPDSRIGVILSGGNLDLDRLPW